MFKIFERLKDLITCKFKAVIRSTCCGSGNIHNEYNNHSHNSSQQNEQFNQ